MVQSILLCSLLLKCLFELGWSTLFLYVAKLAKKVQMKSNQIDLIYKARLKQPF